MLQEILQYFSQLKTTHASVYNLCVCTEFMAILITHFKMILNLFQSFVFFFFCFQAHSFLFFFGQLQINLIRLKKYFCPPSVS